MVEALVNHVKNQIEECGELVPYQHRIGDKRK